MLQLSMVLRHALLHGIKCSDTLFQDRHLLRTVLSAGLLLFGLIIGAVGSLLEVHLLTALSHKLLKVLDMSTANYVQLASFALNRPCVVALIRTPAWG